MSVSDALAAIIERAGMTVAQSFASQHSSDALPST
jgi:hypothetical protein